MSSLIAQLVGYYEFDLSTNQELLNPIPEKTTELSNLFKNLINQLPEDISLWIAIDGITYLGNEFNKDETSLVIQTLCKITQATNKSIRILFVAPSQGNSVFEVFGGHTIREEMKDVPKGSWGVLNVGRGAFEIPDRGRAMLDKPRTIKRFTRSLPDLHRGESTLARSEAVKDYWKVLRMKNLERRHTPVVLKEDLTSDKPLPITQWWPTGNSTSVKGEPRWQVPPFQSLGILGTGTTGLIRQNNICYMNAVIQYLSGIIPLSEYLLKGNYKTPLTNNIPTRVSSPALSTVLAYTLRGIWSGDYSVFNQEKLRVYSICSLEYKYIKAYYFTEYYCPVENNV